MPTLGYHVPTEELADEVKKRAKAAGKKPSLFVWEIVKAVLDHNGPSDAMSPCILVDLTRDLCGKVNAKKIEKLLAGKDQPSELKALIEFYLSAEKTNSVSDGEDSVLRKLRELEAEADEALDLRVIHHGRARLGATEALTEDEVVAIKGFCFLDIFKVHIV